MHDGKYQSCSVRGNRAVSMWSVYCVAVGTRRHDRLSATSRSVASSQSQLLMLFGVWMPQGVASTSSRSVVRSTFQQCFLSSPPAVYFGLIRWSTDRYNHHVFLCCSVFLLVRASSHGRHFHLPISSVRVCGCVASLPLSEPEGLVSG